MANDRIVQRLVDYGVPSDQLDPSGLVSFVKDKEKLIINELVSVILCTDVGPEVGRQEALQESLVWLQWLMFEGDPSVGLKDLSLRSSVSVCRSVWGIGGTDIVYSCNTCALHQTSAVCAPCFRNGNHIGHDFKSTYASGGCCDCGDVTAWKREGFCSTHQGAEHIQPLPMRVAQSISTVLTCLFRFWKGKLMIVSDYNPTTQEIANDLNFVVADLLLQFCNYSESLHLLIANLFSDSTGLLSVLFPTERFSSKYVVKKLHELFYKLLGISTFKNQFAEVFLSYYPTVIEETIKERCDLPLKKCPLLSMFSAEILTVPTLTSRLVKEMNLLTMLLGWFENIFASCTENDRLQVSRLVHLYETARRVAEDISFVMSHVEVSEYVTNNHQDIPRTWLKLLSYVQGMSPQKRETDQHIEYEDQNVNLLFALGQYIAKVHSLFVDGTFSDLGHAKAERLSQERFARNVTSSSCVFASPKVVKMINECLMAVENWLSVEYASEASFLSLPDWPKIDHAVSSQDISVHIPLHRLLSMLLKVALKRYCCDSKVLAKTEISVANSPSTFCSDFFGYALQGRHPHGFSAFIMENPLSIRVFCAEVNAGMWCRNGLEASLSFDWYRSVRWPEQSLELDIFLLQCCAALAPEESFVTRILERFGLSNYLNLNFERSNEYEHVLIKEMLSLIIQIVKERRFCGLTTVESMKRELIYKLSIQNATYNQLVESLPYDLLKYDKFQDVLDSVAAHSSPSATEQGMYSLQSPLWREMDLYHPRWNSKDLQRAEERYLHFCSVSAPTTQMPKWTAIYHPLKGIAKIATSKVVMEIIRAVLFYAVGCSNPAESRAPDSVLLTALHLLSLSLDICIQHKENNDTAINNMLQIPVIALSGEEVYGSSVNGVGKQSLLSLLVALMEMKRMENDDNNVEAGGFSALIESLLKIFAELDDGCRINLQKLAPQVVNDNPERVPTGDPSVSLLASESEKLKAKGREMQAAALEHMKTEQKKFLDSVELNVDDDSQVGHEGDLDTEHDSEESKQHICCVCLNKHTSENPISFLILLQKSRLVSSVDRGPPSDKEHMSVSNTKEIEKNQNSGSLDSTSSSDSTQLVQNAASELEYSEQPGEVNIVQQYIKDHFPALEKFLLLGIACDEKESCTFKTLEQCMHDSICDKMHDLINEDKEVPTAEGNSNVRIAGSALLGTYVGREMSEMSSASGHASKVNTFVESTSQHLANDGFGPTDCDGVHLSSCGHAVHQKCFIPYVVSLNTSTAEGGRHAVDQKLVEVDCPVCRRLVNGILPILPGDLNNPLVDSTCSIRSTAPFADLNDGAYHFRLHQAFNLLMSAANAVEEDKFLKAIPLHHIDDQSGPNIVEVSSLLSKMYLPEKQDKLSTVSEVNHSLLMWETFKYSLTTMEIVARCGKINFTPNFDPSILIEELKSSSGFVLYMLLKLVQKTRSTNSIHVLQRFRGVKLFAASFCSGISLRGDRLNVSGMNQSNTDICFWNQASDPVLSHDPFSTLMWVLFCLPHPFLSCEESLLSLVHAFYMVAVTQAIILYYEKYQDKSSSESAASHCMITDINKIMGKSRRASQYFVSNYSDPTVDIENSIRRFSFPYLRRCALLLKILRSSISTPHCYEKNMSRDTMDSVDIKRYEFTKIEELEKMFKIPPLNVVLKDEHSRSSVSIWCRHFCKEIDARRAQRNIYVTPAVPLKLITLPKVYQDLLERLVKQQCDICQSCFDDPALCLLCGTLCSPSWKSCCRESKCETHSVACGAGSGVFLLLKRTTILLQRSTLQVQVPLHSPYLNNFGAEDFEMTGGKQLFLNEERYAALTYMVASHGLHKHFPVLTQPDIG